MLDELAYTNLPDEAVVLKWLAPIHDGGTPIYGISNFAPSLALVQLTNHYFIKYFHRR